MLGRSPVYRHIYPHRYLNRDFILDPHNNISLHDYRDGNEHQHCYDYSVLHIDRDFNHYLTEFCHYHGHGDIDLTDHGDCVYYFHDNNHEPSDYQFDGDRDVHVCLHSDDDGDRNFYGDYHRLKGNRIQKLSVIGGLIVMFVLATGMAAFITVPIGVNAQTQPHSTSTTIVTSSTEICFGTQCFLLAPPKVTVTSTTTSTRTTSLTDTATSTSTTTTTIPTTTTETMTQVFSTTELTTTTVTSTSTETTTTVSPTTITSTQTSTETSTESSTVTGTSTETTTQITTVNETTTTTITTTVTVTTSGSGGGGGSGCVLQGSLITLANGTAVAVQNVVPGMTVLSYDTGLGQLVPTTVTSNAAIVTPSVLDINNGTLFASGPLDQRVFVMFSNGTTSWIPIQNMQVGMKVFEPLTSTWLPVVSLNWVSGAFTVYDLRTDSPSANNYIANGILMDVKPA